MPSPSVSVPTSRRRRSLAAIEIPLTGTALRSYRSWERKARIAGGAVRQFVPFATWFPPAKDAWLARAQEAGLWSSSTEARPDGSSCHAPDADAVLDHVRDTDGTTFHLFVVDTGTATAFKGAWCGSGLPDSFLECHWQDDQRLLYDEMLTGQPCRGCGRPLIGGPRWVPIRDRSPDEAAALEAEEAAFRALHPDCRAAHWTVGYGYLIHCARCCPPPPMSPATWKQVNDLLSRFSAEHRERERAAARHWREAR